MMQALLIKTYLDKYLDYPKAGDTFYRDAKNIIDAGGIVVFDMLDVDGIPTVFLNTSLGHLLDDYGVDKVKQSIRTGNMPRSQVDRMRRYIAIYQQTTANKA